MTLTCNKTAQQQRLAQNNKTPTEVQFPPLLLTTQNKLKGFEINTRHMTPAAPPPPPPQKKEPQLRLYYEQRSHSQSYGLFNVSMFFW